jgi:hypothetical protein
MECGGGRQMSFREVPRKQPGGTLGAAMTAALYRTGRNFSFRLLLGRELLDELAWDEQVRVRLLFGEGRDQGRARLQPTPSGGSRLMRPARNRPDSGCLVFATQRLPDGITDRPHSAALVPHQLAGDGVEFQMPAWFYTQQRA